MLLAFGIACALLEARRSGRGQVVDAAMVEGASLLTTMFAGMRSAGTWVDRRGSNIARHGRPLVRLLRDARRAPHGGRRDRTKFYPRSSTVLALDPASAAGAARSRPLARAAGRVRRGLSPRAPATSGAQIFARQRRLRGAGADFRRGAAASARDARAARSRRWRASRSPLRHRDCRARPAERAAGPAGARRRRRAALVDWGFDAAAIARSAAAGLGIL